MGRVLNVFAKSAKNLAYISIGVAIFGFIEIGIYWELVALFVIAVVLASLAHQMIVMTGKQLCSEYNIDNE